MITHHQLTRGTYATSSTFTADALAFAKANGINAQDGVGLLRLIAQRTPEQQAALLTVAFDGEYWRPTCPSWREDGRPSGAQERRALLGLRELSALQIHQPMTRQAAARLAA